MLISQYSCSDEGQIGKLQQLGMTLDDEVKLMAMREYISKLANATSRYVMCSRYTNSILIILSFSSRLNPELDMGMSLRMIGDIELQKLGVVPQTVFLRTRSAFSEYVSRASRVSVGITASAGSRISTYSTYSPSRTPLTSPQKPGLLSTDITSTASNFVTPFEDLRRRLATMNGSVSSLATAHRPTPISKDTKNVVPPVLAPHAPAAPVVPLPSPSVSSVAIPHPVVPESITPTIDRPGSPAGSIVSTVNSTSFRPLSRMQLSGSVIPEGAKAAPAVGQSKANAIGLLEAHSKYLRDTEGSPERSEGSLPFSAATAMGPRRSRQPSVQPISTYGALIYHSCVIYRFLMLR